MPSRKIPIIEGEIYHVLNRSIARQPIFTASNHYKRALELLNYYNYQKPRLRFSHFNRLPVKQKQAYIEDLTINGVKQTRLLAFCIMPNHVHFLIQEIKPNGISNFMRNFQNSYAKYFNLKSKRSGSVFQSLFKAIRVETDEQVLHVCRYIHLNPLTAYLIKEPTDLEKYQWSSFLYYINQNIPQLVDTKLVLDLFPSTEIFKKFTFDQLDYQRQLDQIKHLLLE